MAGHSIFLCVCGEDDIERRVIQKKNHRFTSTCLLYNVSYVSLLGDCNLNVYLSHPVIPAVANTLTYSYLHYLQGMNATCHKTISL